MKNIFLLPTDQPSRLVKIKDTFFLTTTDDIPGGTFYNIYITSDEEIKEGDYCVDGNDIYGPYEDGDIATDKFIKIILTTDSQLIRYGVQSINDEFLKWFVENPSCEFVEVNKNNRMYERKTLRNEVKRYDEEYIKTNRALGELGHPDTPTLNLERVSHKIMSLKEDGNTFYGKALVLDTPYGQIVKNFIDNGVNLGVSSRALGSVTMTKEGYNLVQDL